MMYNDLYATGPGVGAIQSVSTMDTLSRLVLDPNEWRRAAAADLDAVS
jgi:hypothetical protein